MTHIVAGYPNLKESERVAELMMDAGVEYLEIQIPFSDPIADGATIMQANQESLENGTTPEDCFEMMKRLSGRSETKLLFMTYFNIAFRYGLEDFCKRAQEVGCYGLIIPDIPLDEEPAEHYLELCQKYELHAIQVISPITPSGRLEKIAKVASGFVYCVARTGTTGTQASFDLTQLEYLSSVKKYIKLPIAVGFGISSVEQLQQVLAKSDIAVIGSHLIKIHQSNGILGIETFLNEL